MNEEIFGIDNAIEFLIDETFIKSMKEKIKANDLTNNILENMIDDGVDEDEALDFMIYSWLNYVGLDK